MNRYLFGIYQWLPDGLKCSLSKFYYHPLLGKKVKLFGRIQFEENVCIGDYTYIHGFAYLARIHIGKFCSIAKNLSCITSNHDYKQFSTYPFASDITRVSELAGKKGFDNFIPILPNSQSDTTEIGNDVWIGENVSIMRGVIIGDGAVIGTNSLVIHEIPPYAIAVGCPARIIK